MPDLPMTWGRLALAAALAALTAPRAEAEVDGEAVGEIGVGWLGNDIVVEAFPDPEVAGVTCHVAYFERGLLERMARATWFADARNTAVSCRRTGPIALGEVSDAPGGEEVFGPDLSAAFETLRVRRLLDRDNGALIYVVHAREPRDGVSALAISTVPLPEEALAGP